jgi:FkbM family methyltransferase
MLPFRHIDFAFPHRPNVIAEIGAADGLDTLRYMERYPHAVVHAFEPLLTNVEKLRTLEVRFSQLVVHPYALGDKNKGTADFYVSGGAPPNAPRAEPWPYSSSLLPPDQHLAVHPWCTFEKLHTSVGRLDSVMYVAPDYIHMDVQGAELKVLEGAGKLLSDVRAIWMEVAEVPLYRDQPLRADVETFMQDHGFHLIAHHGSHISGDQFWKRLK